MLKRMKLAVALLVAIGGPARAGTLFDDLGGKPGIDRIVTEMLTVVSTDRRIADTFENTNLVRLKRMLEEQLCALSGGGCQYSGQSMAAAHKGLHLATFQFNALAEDLQTAMDQLDIAFSTQNRLMALLAPMHRDIVTR